MLIARIGHNRTIACISQLILTSFRFSRSWVWLLYNPHDNVSELPVWSTLIRLSKKTSHHGIGWTPVHQHFFLLDYVCNKKYRMWMCFFLLPLDALPFFSRSISLLLSRKMMFSWTTYYWASKKFPVQIIPGMKSSTLTNSVSVELRVFRFCFIESDIGKTIPIQRPLTERPCIFGWTPYDPSIHHFDTPVSFFADFQRKF